MADEALLVHSPLYQIDLSEFGIGTDFALDRGSRIMKALAKDGVANAIRVAPDMVSEDDLSLVHTPEYLKSLEKPETWVGIFELSGEQANHAKRKRNWKKVLDNFRIKAGGTVMAAEIALRTGLAANLGAGYHHSHADHGHGFCAINDIAIAIRQMQKKNLCRKVLVVDVDLHQGDGTAKIFANDSDVFTLSLHSAEAFPIPKAKSSLDVEIRRSESHLYLTRLKRAVRKALAQFKPDLVIFVQGSDPYEKDQLTLKRYFHLTLDELKERDEFVINTFADLAIPLALVFAGGYGPDVWEVHYNAVKHLLKRASAAGHQTSAS